MLEEEKKEEGRCEHFCTVVGNVSAYDDGCDEDQRFVHLLILRVLVASAHEKRFVIFLLYSYYFKIH